MAGRRDLASSHSSSRPAALRAPAVKCSTRRGQPLEQRSRRPIITETVPILAYTAEHHRQAHRVGMEHRAATMTQKTEPLDINHINIAGAQSIAFLENVRAFIG